VAATLAIRPFRFVAAESIMVALIVSANSTFVRYFNRPILAIGVKHYKSVAIVFTQ
jgi:hypothetical protein